MTNHNPDKRKSLPFWLIGLGLAAVLAVLAWLPATSQATASGTLPSRETPTPTRGGGPTRGGDEEHDDDGPPPGAYIELAPSPGRAGLWAGVQWQNEAGHWYDVEGWQGTLPGSSRWWVAPQDFGTGPFRWVIYADRGGPVLGTSAPFSLPHAAGETMWVPVNLAP